MEKNTHNKEKLLIDFDLEIENELDLKGIDLFAIQIKSNFIQSILNDPDEDVWNNV